ncbi:hypothetical protein ABIB48_002307 [Arthrobacter sp. UYCu511]
MVTSKPWLVWSAFWAETQSLLAVGRRFDGGDSSRYGCAMKQKPGSGVRRAWMKVILMLAIPVLFLVWVIIVVPALVIYDSFHPVAVQCTVKSTSLYEGSKRYVPFRVIIETDDCGDVSVARGVTAENQQDIADSFVLGERYEFTVGKFELEWWSPLKQKAGGTLVAEHYRKILT